VYELHVDLDPARLLPVIVSLHVATGAAGGAAVRSRPAAIALGFLLHLVGDVIPHDDIPSPRFELWSGVAGLTLLAITRGPLDAATIGAAAASSPDLEHVIRMPRPGGRKLFPSHRIPVLHQAGGLPTWLQLLAAGALLAAVVRR
jgi:hypothetical protein